MEDGLKIAVVGGAGFIGTRLVDLLRDDGARYLVIDKRQTKANVDTHVVCDVRDAEGIVRALDGCACIVNLAAEHRDDVTPKDLYYDVNVRGAVSICDAARALGIRRIVFTSSVAVYGFSPQETDEGGCIRPFSEYGRTKHQAEAVYLAWQAEEPTLRSLTIVRPTAVFGERNRGNAFSLFRGIYRHRFVMVGSGRNRKSLAYVENVARFLVKVLELGPGARTFNYADKPDFDMNQLVQEVNRALGRTTRGRVSVPCSVAYLAGLVSDGSSWVLRRKFSISSIRVRKLCAETRFCSSRIGHTGFTPPVSLSEGIARTIRYEFLERHSADVSYTE